MELPLQTDLALERGVGGLWSGVPPHAFVSQSTAWAFPNHLRAWVAASAAASGVRPVFVPVAARRPAQGLGGGLAPGRCPCNLSGPAS